MDTRAAENSAYRLVICVYVKNSSGSYTCIHTHAHAYDTHKSAYAYAHLCMGAHTHTLKHTHAHTHACKQICTNSYIHVPGLKVSDTEPD